MGVLFPPSGAGPRLHDHPARGRHDAHRRLDEASGIPPRSLAMTSRVRSELRRKGVHVGMGALALLLRWLTPLQAGACALGALLFNLFFLHRVTRSALLRAHETARG